MIPCVIPAISQPRFNPPYRSQESIYETESEHAFRLLQRPLGGRKMFNAGQKSTNSDFYLVVVKKKLNKSNKLSLWQMFGTKFAA